MLEGVKGAVLLRIIKDFKVSQPGQSQSELLQKLFSHPTDPGLISPEQLLDMKEQGAILAWGFVLTVATSFYFQDTYPALTLEGLKQHPVP